MLVTIHAHIVVAIAEVGGIKHVVAHEQAFVLVVLNAVDAARHERVVGTGLVEVGRPLG